jgi:sec-independent protein translocase protein TatC
MKQKLSKFWGTDRKEMPFLEHLEELRKVLLDSLIAVFIGAIGCWFVSERIAEFLIRPVGETVFLAPAEALTTRIKISVVAGFMVVLPFILFRVWRFVLPGLLEKERSLVFPLVSSSVALFFLGVAFCYLVLIPIVMEILLGFGTETLQPMISVGKYLSFVLKFSLTFGIVFQLPLVIVALTWAGIISTGSLVKTWRYAVVAILIACAALTPPDVVSQLTMAGPVALLYFGSILLARFVERRRRATATEDTEKTESVEDTEEP